MEVHLVCFSQTWFQKILSLQYCFAWFAIDLYVTYMYSPMQQWHMLYRDKLNYNIFALLYGGKIVSKFIKDTSTPRDSRTNK